MELTRRAMLAAAGATLAAGTRAADAPLPLELAVRSPWMANQVALTSDGALFLGLPRYARYRPTPSLARREADGTLRPFPGNGWNDWQPGADGRNAFVYLNSVHIFDDTIWCVDQGALSPGIFGPALAVPQPGAQKLVQLDPRSGRVLRILRFDETILLPGAQMNDLRLRGNMLYITDSGLGGIIVHDLASGRTLRRLSGHPLVKATPGRVPAILAHIQGRATFRPPNSDLIELSPDGRWLYWASPTGPFRRLETRLLNDPAVTDADLARHVEPVFDNAFSGGCAMDSLGNLYCMETATHHITVRPLSGSTATLVSDPRLVRPDGGFISRDRRLYVPVKQAISGEKQQLAFAVYSIALPKALNGLALGRQIL